MSQDSKPKCRIVPTPLTKIHQIQYLTIPNTTSETKDILAVSTEDGRILFYDTADVVVSDIAEPASKAEIPASEAICQLGGSAEGIIGRVKDFEILKPPGSEDIIVITGSSDGAVRLWTLDASELINEPSTSREMNEKVSILANSVDSKPNGNATKNSATRQIGLLLGTFEAGNRITCLKAFVMSEPESVKTNGSKNGITGKYGKESDFGDTISSS